MMMQNVITVAFDGVKALPVCVELLEAFHSLSKRVVITRAVEKRAAAVWTAFKASLDANKVRYHAELRVASMFAAAVVWSMVSPH